jgi:hypothetical protein
MADTWSQCRCDTNNEKCQQDACADYGNQYLLVNIPAPYDKWNVATRWEDKVSYLAPSHISNSFGYSNFIVFCSFSCRDAKPSSLAEILSISKVSMGRRGGISARLGAGPPRHVSR